VTGRADTSSVRFGDVRLGRGLEQHTLEWLRHVDGVEAAGCMAVVLPALQDAEMPASLGVLVSLVLMHAPNRPGAFLVLIDAAHAVARESLPTSDRAENLKIHCEKLSRPDSGLFTFAERST
jgi:hypothetical protein